MNERRTDVRVRALRPDEASLHRDVRLRALRQSPNSFGETYADIAGRSPSYWEDQTKAVTEPGRNVMFVACDDTRANGMVYGLLDRDRRDGGRVGGMWVDPSNRRRGIGREMLAAVIGWCGERELKRLGLWAPAGNPAAIAFYRDAGFRETDNRRRLREGHDLEIVEMTRAL